MSKQVSLFSYFGNKRKNQLLVNPPSKKTKIDKDLDKD